MKKLLYLDLETTGLYPDKHGIIQISGEVEIEGKTEEQFNYTLQPFKGQLITKEALEINGRTVEEIKAFEEPRKVFNRFEAMLNKYINKFNKKDKFFMVGYNSHSFDSQFLRQFFLSNQHQYYGSYFWSAGLDVMLLAVPVLAHKRPDMENFKLMTVARELGIEVNEDRLHDAEYDIEITKAIFKKVI